jgi:hypothetical protein
LQLSLNGTISVGGVIGDYNHDGAVEAADYTLWRDSLGSTNNLAADGNAGGMIGARDCDAWNAHFGQSAPARGASASTTAPELAAVWMLLIGLAGFIFGASLPA